MSSTKWSHKHANLHPQYDIYMATMHKVYGSLPKRGTFCHIIHLSLDSLVRTPLKLILGSPKNPQMWKLPPPHLTNWWGDKKYLLTFFVAHLEG